MLSGGEKSIVGLVQLRKSGPMRGLKRVKCPSTHQFDKISQTESLCIFG